MKKTTGIRVLALVLLVAAVLPVSLAAQGADSSLAYDGPLAVYHYVTDNWAALSKTTALSGDDSVIKKLIDTAGSLEGDPTKIDSELELAYLLEKASLTPNITIITPDKMIGRVIETYFAPLADEKDVYYDLCLAFQMRKVGLMFSSSPTKARDIANCDLAIKSLIKNEGLDPAVVESRYKTAVAAEVDRAMSEEFAKVSFGSTDGIYKITISLKSGGYDVNYGNSAVGFNTVSVSALSDLSKYGFTSQQIEDCLYQAQNIPLVAIAKDPKAEEIYKLLVELVKTFFKEPTEKNLNNLIAIHYSFLYKIKYSSTNREFYVACAISYLTMIKSINPSLCDAIEGPAAKAVRTGTSVAFNPDSYKAVFDQSIEQ